MHEVFSTLGALVVMASLSGVAMLVVNGKPIEWNHKTISKALRKASGN